MIEVKRRGKHCDEFELEFKPCVAAIERLGRIWFEGRWGRLDGGKSRSFVQDTLCHLSLTFTEREMRLGVGLTPIRRYEMIIIIMRMLHETSTRVCGRGLVRDRGLRGAPIDCLVTSFKTAKIKSQIYIK